MNTKKLLTLKERICFTLENHKDTEQSPLHNYINLFLSTLIIANVFAMILQTMDMFKHYIDCFSVFENISLSIFTLEYIARLWTYKLHEKYINFSSFVFSPMMIFDAFVILPHLVNLIFPNILDLRILRIIRVFRIFRLYKYSNTINKIFDITRRHKHVLLSAFSFIMMGVVSSATLMYFAEKDVQPDAFSSIPQSIYWAVITISTVGYGDVSPMTDLGKFITVCTTIMGVAIYALPTSILGAAFYAELMSKESHIIDGLRKENKHLDYLLNDARREMQILRDIIKKEREKSRENKEEKEDYDDEKKRETYKKKIRKKFLNLFK